VASSSALDIEAILRPVSDDAPAGENLREDTSSTSLYYRLKEARSTARTAERQAEAPDEEGTAKSDSAAPKAWCELLGGASQALTESTKDLEIAAWLIEALCRIEGFAGLRAGFRIARGLVDTFWDELWPRRDEDGFLSRLAALGGLNGEDAPGTLIAPIARVPITEGGEAYASWHYYKALEISREKDLQLQEQQAAAAGVTLQSFQRCVDETPSAFYEQLLADLGGSLEEFDGLCRALEDRCGDEAPPSSNIRNALSSVLETVQGLTRGRLESASTGEPGAAEDPVVELTPSPRAGTLGGALNSREEAFQALEKVARFFRNTEPHSPLSYVLEQAVRWGRLPLPDLLQELISDETARGDFMKLTGIRAPEQ